MIRLIDQIRDRFGVEAVSRVSRPAVRGFLSSRGYRAAKDLPASARQLRDELLVPAVARLHAENYGVYGRRNTPCSIEAAGVESWPGLNATADASRVCSGRGRSKRMFTPRRDPASVMPVDLVQRRFTAAGSRRLWAADVTYVATWSWFAYVAFVTDVYPRRIVGWNVAATLKADILSLRALDMAAWGAGGNPDGPTPSFRSRLELHGPRLHRPNRRARGNTLDWDC